MKQKCICTNEMKTILSGQLSERLSAWGKVYTERPWVRNFACKATILLYFDI
jgi:hypothetical protein